MSQAARVFAQQLANRMAGGLTVKVDCLQLSGDGMTGLYEVKVEFHHKTELISVSRGFMVPKPKEN